MALMNKNISFKSFWPMRENTHTCFHGYQLVWVNTYMADQIDYRIMPRTDLADGCVLVKPCSDHIFAVGNPDCFHKQVSPCWDSQPQVQLFRLLSHLLSGLKWTILANMPGLVLTKSNRSDSRLTKCPFLIKFTGIYLNKNDQHCHQCALVLWNMCVA